MFYMEIVAVFSDPHKIYNYIVRAECSIVKFNLVVHIVTTGFLSAQSTLKYPVR
jgi:hypothetical protein